MRPAGHSTGVFSGECVIPAYLIGAFAAFSALAFVISPLRHDWASLGPIWAVLFCVVVCGQMIADHLSLMIGRFMEYAGLFFALSIAASLTGSLLATTAFPLVDSHLSQLDQTLGFDWFRTFTYWKSRPGVLEALSVIYSTLAWQPIILLGAFAILGLNEAAGKFLTAWGIALILCMAIFPLMPAHGNFLFNGIERDHAPGIWVDAAWAFADGFDALRAGSVTFIDRTSLDGVVTFPSFHTSAAILLAAGFSHLRALTVPLCILNALMIVSAIFVGAHYFVDILAGIAIAIAALLLAERQYSERFDDYQHDDQREQNRRDLAEQA